MPPSLREQVEGLRKDPRTYSGAVWGDCIDAVLALIDAQPALDESALADIATDVGMRARTLAQFVRLHGKATGRSDINIRKVATLIEQMGDESVEAILAAPSSPSPALDESALAAALRTIEDMSGDAADLHDLMDEAASLRTALAHVLVRTHDSGCGTCDAARALLTADHELPKP